MKSITTLVAAVTLVIGAFAGIRPVSAQPPRVQHADIDYEASGFVMPASGQMPPGAIAGLTQQGPVQRTGYTAQAGPGYVPPMQAQAGGYAPQHSMQQGSVQQVGFFGGGGSSCDSCGGGCDGACGASYGMDPNMAYGGMGYGGAMYGGCDGACGGACGGTGACGMGGGGVLSNGGVLGKMYGGGSACGGCGQQGCGHCGGLSNLRHMCVFCRGDGCEACQMFNGRSLVGCLGALMPYTEAGKCAQRWYDVSVEGLFMSRSGAEGVSGVLTQRGAGPGGTPVIRGEDAINDDLEEGIRLSGSLIFGAGGNIEGTYMGGQEWKGSASASSPATLVANGAFDPLATSGPTSFPFVISSGADLYSFISEFGTNPVGGFDDTDRSISQTATSVARFHSGELNYRRRTVGPYCRFQGSWLVGMRYLRYDNSLGLDIVGLNNDGTDATLTDGTQRFFSSSDGVKNNMFGAQIGGDLWWNVIPGVQLGMEAKGAWLKNEATRQYSISANSIAGGGPGTIRDRYREDDGTLALEFSTQLVYRFSHSWSFKSAYYLIAIDEVGSPELNGEFIRDAVASPSTAGKPGMEFDSLVLNGFSFGAEYLW
ncbi:BBP7 family outer membrane beta-barrel protein [Rubripirellula lacrimiformis]|nr:BBP7 family outer membrane beta-barrel protein [Rubripirellula lacrimiformis]